ncbi:hypothetical protein ACWDA9_06125, partial [Streptomyces sp. NPDC001193]
MITPCPATTFEDASVPWTPPSRPSRRSLLAGAAGAAGVAGVAGAALLTGCSDGGGSPDTGGGVPLERRMRETAVRESERLLERYDATAAAHPALAARRPPLRAAVAAPAGALAPPDPPPARPPGSAPPS